MNREALVTLIIVMWCVMFVQKSVEVEKYFEVKFKFEQRDDLFR